MNRAQLAAAGLAVGLAIVTTPVSAHAETKSPEERSHFAMSAALQLPYGRATGAPGDAERELVGNNLRLGFALWSPFGPRVRSVLEGAILVGAAGTTLRRLCRLYDEACFQLGLAASYELEWALARAPRWELWAKNGLGAEVVGAGSSKNVSAVLVGLDFLRPALGIDMLLGPAHRRVGFYLQNRVGTYVSANTNNGLENAGLRPIRDKGVHASFALGARVVF